MHTRLSRLQIRQTCQGLYEVSVVSWGRHLVNSVSMMGNVLWVKPPSEKSEQAFQMFASHSWGNSSILSDVWLNHLP